MNNAEIKYPSNEYKEALDVITSKYGEPDVESIRIFHKRYWQSNHSNNKKDIMLHNADLLLALCERQSSEANIRADERSKIKNGHIEHDHELYIQKGANMERSRIKAELLNKFVNIKSKRFYEIQDGQEIWIDKDETIAYISSLDAEKEVKE